MKLKFKKSIVILKQLLFKNVILRKNIENIDLKQNYTIICLKLLNIGIKIRYITSCVT